MFPLDPYSALKLFQDRQAEFELKVRRGLYVIDEMQKDSELQDQESERRGWRHKWFGSKRLYTSWK